MSRGAGRNKKRDKLRILTTVAERGSISASAKELALTQPAISRAIQTVEQSVGYPLFARNRGGMQPTEGGRIVLEAASRVLKEMGDAVERGAHAREEMAGQIRIGTYESLAEYLWPEFLIRIQKEFPRLSLHLTTNSAEGHLAELNAGVLDLLVDAEPRSHAGLTLWPLYSDRFSFFASSKIDLDPEAAKDLSILLVRGAYDEDNVTLEEHLSRAGYRFQREYLFDSFTTARRMAKQGIGIAILPRRLADQEEGLRPVHAKGFKESFGPHRIYATISPRRESDRRIKTLVARLRKQLSPSSSDCGPKASARTS